MIQKSLIILCLLCIIPAAFAAEKGIVLLSVDNVGDAEYEYYSQFIPNYIYLFLKDVSDIFIVPPDKVIPYLFKNNYQSLDMLKDEVVKEVADHFFGNFFGLVWKEVGGAGTIRCQLLSRDGVLLDDTSLQLSRDGNTAFQPKIVWDGTFFAVVWQEDDTDNYDILFCCWKLILMIIHYP